MGKPLKILLVIALLPLIVGLVIVAVPVAIAVEAKAASALRAFRRREAGTVYLVCTGRHGWHDFLVNNVIPVLPERFRVVWRERARDAGGPPLLDHLARSRIFDVPKPYLVVVTRDALTVRTLNRELQDLKRRPKRSEETRRRSLEIITRRLAARETPPAGPRSA